MISPSRTAWHANRARVEHELAEMLAESAVPVPLDHVTSVLAALRVLLASDARWREMGEAALHLPCPTDTPAADRPTRDVKEIKEK